MKVAIGVITFHRPAGLRRLLDSLAQLELGQPIDGTPRVIVVDNDPEQSAADVCELARSELSLEIEYISEPRRGIPFARNAVLEAAGSFDAIAFVDDDEVVPPHWLITLARAQEEYGADAVTGPMEAHFVTDPPDWVIAGRYFVSPTRYPTGSYRPVAASGNVLFTTEAVRRYALRFDTRFALSGGSDTHFFQRLVRAGGRIVWIDEAEATEWIPESRVSPAWLRQRAYRLGTTAGLCARDLDRGRPGALVIRFAKGCGRMAQGLILLVPNAVLPGRRVIDAQRMLWFGWGTLAGLLAGRHFPEYEDVHEV